MINHSELQIVYFWTAYSDLEFLKAFVQAGYKDFNAIHNGRPVWSYVLTSHTQKRTAETIEYLMDLNANVFASSKVGTIAIDYAKMLVHHGVKSDDAIRIYNVLLDKMRQQTTTPDFPVPMHCVWEIQKEIIYILNQNYLLHSNSRSDEDKELHLQIQALNMVLEAGVANLNFKCTTSTPSCKCKVKKPLFRMCSRTYTRLINTSLDVIDPGLFRFIAQFYITLQRYGNKPNKSLSTFLTQIVSYETEPLYYYAEVSLSLMDHQDWLFVQRKFSRLYHRLEQSNPTNQNGQEDKERKQDLIKCFQSPRSLKQMCRKVLYDNVPDRRMAAHIKQLKLPIMLEPYILLE